MIAGIIANAHAMINFKGIREKERGVGNNMVQKKETQKAEWKRERELSVEVGGITGSEWVGVWEPHFCFLRTLEENAAFSLLPFQRN